MRRSNCFELLKCEMKRHKSACVFVGLILAVIVTAWISVISIAMQVPKELDEYADDGRTMSFGISVLRRKQLENLNQVQSRITACMVQLGDFPEIGAFENQIDDGLWGGASDYLIHDDDKWVASVVNERIVEGEPFSPEDNFTGNIWISDVLSERNQFHAGDVILLNERAVNNAKAEDLPSQCCIKGIYRTDEEFNYSYVAPYSLAKILSGGGVYDVFFRSKSVLGYWKDIRKLEKLGFDVTQSGEEEMKGYVFVIYALLVTAGLVTVLLMVILFLLVRMHMLRRRRYYALLRVEGVCGGELLRLVRWHFVILAAVAFLLALITSPLVVHILRETLIEVLGGSKLSISPFSWWNALALVLLYVLSAGTVWVAVRTVRQKEIIRLLKAEK